MSNVVDPSEAFPQSSISSDSNKPLVSAAGGNEAATTGKGTPIVRSNVSIKNQRKRTVRRTRKRLRVTRKALQGIVRKSDFKLLY